MVKNTGGGNRAKNMARKDCAPSSAKLRLASDPDEKYALVTKMLGNGMCRITTDTNMELLCHIRNKFRGKRNNVITVNTLLLIGLRDWEKPAYKNCDVLEIYSHNEQTIIANSNINLAAFMPEDTNEIQFQDKDEVESDVPLQKRIDVDLVDIDEI